MDELPDLPLSRLRFRSLSLPALSSLVELEIFFVVVFAAAVSVPLHAFHLFLSLCWTPWGHNLSRGYAACRAAPPLVLKGFCQWLLSSLTPCYSLPWEWTRRGPLSWSWTTAWYYLPWPIVVPLLPCCFVSSGLCPASPSESAVSRVHLPTPLESDSSLPPLLLAAARSVSVVPLVVSFVVVVLPPICSPA